MSSKQQQQQKENISLIKIEEGKKKYPFACQIIIYDYINHLESMVYNSGKKTTFRFALKIPHFCLPSATIVKKIQLIRNLQQRF